MITIITGTPGAGKTLYTVDKLLQPLIGTTVKQEVDGEVIEHPRTIYTNINGLMLDHEKIDGSAQGGLRNWHEWAKPGAVIVVDEVQKIWEPRANGSKVPADIQALETHRHMGVDFIFITQGLMLTERNLCMLCNRHLHVRRMGNMGLTIVYEWDHASRTLMYSKAVSKSPYRYNKSVFKLYKSSQLHTKQPRRIPSLVWFVIAGMVGLTYLAPSTYTRLAERTGIVKKEEKPEVKTAIAADKPKESMAQALQAPATHAQAAISVPDERVDFIPRISDRPWTAPAYDHLRTVVHMPIIAGGVCMQGRCVCMTGDGVRLDVSSDACADWMKSRPFNPYVRPPPPNAVAAGAGTASANSALKPDQTGPAPSESVVVVPMPSGVENPRSDAQPASLLPQGSPVRQELAKDGQLPIVPLSLLSPYRRT